MYKQFFFHCVKGKLLQHMNTLFLSILLASFFSPPIGMLKINAALERLMKKKPEKFRLLIRHIFTLAKQIFFRRWKLENSINFVSQVRTSAERINLVWDLLLEDTYAKRREWRKSLLQRIHFSDDFLEKFSFALYFRFGIFFTFNFFLFFFDFEFVLIAFSHCTSWCLLQLIFIDFALD